MFRVLRYRRVNDDWEQGLGAYAPRIRALGARKVADLQLLSDEDIDDLGVPKELRVVLKVSLS